MVQNELQAGVLMKKSCSIACSAKVGSSSFSHKDASVALWKKVRNIKIVFYIRRL
jgi:hypothetical protein